MRSTSPIVALAVLVAMAILSAVSVGVAVLRDRDPRPSLWGVRLGMTATELRARVEERGPGAWTTRLEASDWVLERATDEARASFELHEGQLVAVRIDAPLTSDFPATPAFERTDGSVLVRVAHGDRVEATLLSRSCPTHHDEAERLVAEHGD